MEVSKVTSNFDANNISEELSDENIIQDQENIPKFKNYKNKCNLK